MPRNAIPGWTPTTPPRTSGPIAPTGAPGSDSLSAVEDRQKKIDERGLKNRIYRKAHRDRAPGYASGLAYNMRRAFQLQALVAARAPI
mgnify:CR=1 FL=1